MTTATGGSSERRGAAALDVGVMREHPWWRACVGGRRSGKLLTFRLAVEWIRRYLAALGSDEAEALVRALDRAVAAMTGEDEFVVELVPAPLLEAPATERVDGQADDPAKFAAMCRRMWDAAPAREQETGAPMRKVVSVIERRARTTARARLDCGHEATVAASARQVRCRECARSRA